MISYLGVLLSSLLKDLSQIMSFLGITALVLDSLRKEHDQIFRGFILLM
jgi:hypothetical protein